MSTKVFRPKLWAVLLVLALSALMLTLGAWQLQRGQGKAELLAQFAQTQQQPPMLIAQDAVAHAGKIVWAQVQGQWDVQRQLLLDNQGHNGRPGYRVWTPLLRSEGGVVLVDRGWIAMTGDRQSLPELDAPAGQQTVQGFWRTLPEPGLRLAAENCTGTQWPRIVQYPTLEDVQCLYGPQIASGLLLMGAEQAGGYVRAWDNGPGMVPTKHYGYAAQWLMFTLVLWFFLIKLSFVSRP